MSFQLGEEIFATNVANVSNILEMTKVIKVPLSPSYMKGVINLRGTALPVIDVRIRIGLPSTLYTVNTCIIVLDVDINGTSLQVGCIVDSVHDVIEIVQNQLLPSPTIGKTYRSKFISGMYKIINEQFIMILDMDKLFSNDDEFILDEYASTIEKNSIAVEIKEK